MPEGLFSIFLPIFPKENQLSISIDRLYFTLYLNFEFTRLPK
jgi:hypothetical protein